jgi:hypothetical protein
VSDDADVNAVKVIVGKVGNVPLIFRQRIAFIAAATGVKEFPAVLGRIINGVCVAGDGVLERSIKLKLCAIVVRDGVWQVGATGRAAEDTSEGLLVPLWL